MCDSVSSICKEYYETNELINNNISLDQPIRNANVKWDIFTGANFVKRFFIEKIFAS